MHAGAASKILLAHLEDEKIETFLKTQKLVKYTGKTIVDPDKLRKEIKGIRKAGYAFSEEEIDLGVRALAAPIFDHEGRIAAGLVVFGPVQRIDDHKKEKILKGIFDVSKKIQVGLEAELSTEKRGKGIRKEVVLPRKEMKTPIEMAFVWINQRIFIRKNGVQFGKEEENEEKIWSVDLHCNFGNLIASGQLCRIWG